MKLFHFFVQNVVFLKKPSQIWDVMEKEQMMFGSVL